MKNKSLIILISILFFIVLVIVLGSTVFSVKEVSLNFMSEKVNVHDTDEEIIQNSELKVTGSIFLVNKTQIKETIQKTYPYIRVINVESVFPDKIIINVAEREKFYAVRTETGFAICDEKLGIIDFTSTYSSTSSNAILLEGVNVNSDLVLGMEIDTDELEIIEKISYSLREWELNTNIILGNISAITINHLKPNQIMFSFFSGTTILIENANSNLSNKMNYALSYYDNNYEASQGGTIKVFDTEENTKLIYYKD